MESPHNFATIKIETTAPTVGVLVQWIGGALATLNPGTGVHLTWTASTPGVSGMCYYALNIGTDPSAPDGAYVNNTNVGNVLATDWAPDYHVVPDGLKDWTVTAYSCAGNHATYVKDDFLLQLLMITPPVTQGTVSIALGGSGNISGFYWPIGFPGDFQLGGTVVTQGSWTVWTPGGTTPPVNATSTTFDGLDITQDALGTSAPGSWPGADPVPYTMTDAQSTWLQPGNKTVKYRQYSTSTYVIPTLPLPTTVTQHQFSDITMPVTMVFSTHSR